MPHGRSSLVISRSKIGSPPPAAPVVDTVIGGLFADVLPLASKASTSNLYALFGASPSAVSCYPTQYCSVQTSSGSTSAYCSTFNPGCAQPSCSCLSYRIGRIVQLRITNFALVGGGSVSKHAERALATRPK